MQEKNIVVLGAGFGGLRAAQNIDRGIRKLGLRDRYRVMLIDRQSQHTFTPLLYKLAASPDKDPERGVSALGYQIEALIAGTRISFMKDEVQRIDLGTGGIHLASGKELSCEYLLIAIGSEVNYFGIPGLENHAFALKSILHALRIRESLAKFFSERRKEIRVLVGGGGPTGIEFAAELKALESRYPEGRISVALVEAMPTLLPGFDPRLSSRASSRLEHLGVTVRTNEPIAKVTGNAAISEHGTVFPFDLFVWTGGVKAPAILKELSLKIESRGKIEVGEGMQCLPGTPDLHLRPMVYAIGDSVCFYHPKTQKPVPAIAHAAIVQARIAAHNILEDIAAREGKKRTRKHIPFVPREYPYVVPVGQYFGIAKVGSVIIYGTPAWLFDKLIHAKYLFSIMRPGRAFAVFVKALRLFD